MVVSLAWALHIYGLILTLTYKETIMSYDPSDFGCSDEHVPYEELEGLDLLIADMELSESYEDGSLELDELEDIPY